MAAKAVTITEQKTTTTTSASTDGRESCSKNDPTAIINSNVDSETSNCTSIKAPAVQSTKSNGKFQSQGNGNNNSSSNTAHQFRAPENSVIRSYKRTGGCHTVSSMTGSGPNKKFKSWNKRQNKNNNISGNGGNKFCNLANSVVGTGALTTTANLENIQETRCSVTAGGVVKNSTLPYHNRHHHQHDGGGGGGGEGRPVNGQRLMSLHKKSLSHRTNHKIVGSGLCNGSNLNNVVGGGGNTSNNNLNDSSGIVGVRLKDSTILGVNNISGGLVNGNVAIHLKNHCCLRSKFFLADKRPRKDNFIPPTKFLLGGNISDPLNLNSLQNETGDCSSNDGDSSGRTPRRSPITTPPKVEVIIPPNIHDPLHLLDPVDSVEYEKQLTSPMKKDSAFVKLGGGISSITKNGNCIGHSSKHRNRKNRKLKRRRNDSQTISSGVAAVEHPTSLSGSIEEDNRPLVGCDKSQSHQQQNTADDKEKIQGNSEVTVLPSSETGVNCKPSENQIKTHKVNKRCQVETQQKETEDKKLRDKDNSVGPIEQVKDNCNVITKNLEGGNCKNDEKNPNGTEHSANGIVGGRKRKVSESHSCTLLKLKKFRLDVKDRIVSPVIPQPGTWKRPIHTVSSYNSDDVSLLTNRKSTFQIKYVQDSATDSAKTRGEKDNLRVVDERNQNQPIGEGDVEGDPDSNKRSANATRLTEDITAQKLGDKQQNETVHNVPVSFNKKGSQYCYGNYNRHADVRHVNESMDVRLQVFHRYPELFTNKDVLDIGCNVGYMTMCIAKRFAPKSILGIDIDKKLIDQARRNLSLCVRIPKINPEGQAETDKVTKNRSEGQNKNTSKERSLSATTAKDKSHNNQSIQPNQLFPISFPISLRRIIEDVDNDGNLSNAVATPNSSTRNPIKNCGSTQQRRGNTFPRNVSFRRCNYVLKDESLLAHDVQQYDLIVCLSVTKWIHLNFGDAGLKLAFKRMFNQLRPGGKLILEAQNWTSYKKKKKLNETIYHNFNNIEFFPKKFREYLLSSEVGFSHSHTMGVPKHMNKGFCRPIQLYAKGDYTPNHVRWSDAYYPQTPYEAYRGIYATQPPSQRGGGSGHCGGRSSHVTSIRSMNFETPHYMGMSGGGSTSGPYSSHHQTPLHQANTSQYYNPLETDSYLPSYDMNYLNSMHVFASPLYQTVWSPPACMRTGSASQTPLFGSGGHDPDWAADSSGRRRHVYLPNEENIFSSPTVNPMSAFNSIREPDTDIEDGRDGGSTTLSQQDNVTVENVYQEDDIRISYNRNNHDQEVGENIVTSDHSLPSN